jgi:hypothetical protein
MRILIDTEGVKGVQEAFTGTSMGSAMGSASDETPLDGGSGPNGGAGSDPAVSAQTATDSGAPPDWLLRAVAAAEAGAGHGVGVGEQAGTGVEDGGAAPSE